MSRADYIQRVKKLSTRALKAAVKKKAGQLASRRPFNGTIPDL
jgi:hypothetical protein